MNDFCCPWDVSNKDIGYLIIVWNLLFRHLAFELEKVNKDITLNPLLFSFV